MVKRAQRGRVPSERLHLPVYALLSHLLILSVLNGQEASGMETQCWYWEVVGCKILAALHYSCWQNNQFV